MHSNTPTKSSSTSSFSLLWSHMTRLILNPIATCPAEIPYDLSYFWATSGFPNSEHTLSYPVLITYDLLYPKSSCDLLEISCDFSLWRLFTHPVIQNRWLLNVATPEICDVPLHIPIPLFPKFVTQPIFLFRFPDGFCL